MLKRKSRKQRERETALAALQKYMGLKAELVPKLEMLAEAEAQVKQFVLKTGESVSAAGVTARHRDGYTSGRWDGKALTDFAEENPELLAFRTEYTVKPHVVISLS